MLAGASEWMEHWPWTGQHGGPRSLWQAVLGTWQSKGLVREGLRDKVGLLSHSLGTYSSFSLCPQASSCLTPPLIPGILPVSQLMERTEPWIRAPQLPSTKHTQSLGLACSYLPVSLLPGWWPGPLPSSLPRGLTPQTPLLSWCPPPFSLLTGMSQQWMLRSSLYCLKKCFPWVYFSFHQSSQFPFSVSFLKIVYLGYTLVGSPSGQGHVRRAQQGAQVLALSSFSQRGTFSGRRCIDKVPKGDAPLNGVCSLRCGSWHPAVSFPLLPSDCDFHFCMKTARKMPPCSLRDVCVCVWRGRDTAPKREGWTRWGR